MLKKLEGRRDLRARHGSRLTVSSLHGLPFTPNPRPKRRVETGEDLWPVPQPPGSSSPAYGYPPTANRCFDRVLRFRMRERPAYSNPGPVRAIPGSKYSTVTAFLNDTDTGREALCPPGDVIFMFDNEQVVGKSWSVTAKKTK